jgi:uncharacterized protein
MNSAASQSAASPRPLSAFHVMAKPAGARCNLACDYCFYLKKRRLYPGSDCRMSDEVLEAYIRQTLEAHRTSRVTIAWQGGEPTLMGLEFFERAVAFENKYARPGMIIENTLQTNGTLIDERWCRFFRKNGFLVGLSIDGPRGLHDRYRTKRNGDSVFDTIVRSVRLLQHAGVECNILCTVNSVNAQHPLAVYRFFRDELRTPYLQFIPIVERDHDAGGQNGVRVTAQTVTPAQWGGFLCAIFDEWVRRDVGSMFVQFFDAVLASYVRGFSSVCVLQPRCGLGLALEHTGDLYSCDHYVEPGFFLGNILDTPLKILAGSDRQRAFGSAKSAALPTCCRECEYLFTCHGECPKNRIHQEPDGSGARNWLCEGLKSFFTHSRAKMERMATLIQSGRPAADIMEISRRSAGRNQPCPCGSGKKFKRCHGNGLNPEIHADSL